MAKRKRTTTESVIKKRDREGRGSGQGNNYKPYLRIQDVPSQGLATRARGWKTKRIHHLMSKLEWLYFLILEWSPRVVDIREQYPLELEETLAVADRLNIAHPVDPKTRHPIVMTTDFLISVRKGVTKRDQARTIKPSGKLNSRRTHEKFEIERVYWESRKIDWGIVTEHEINKIVAQNVEWLHPHFYNDGLPAIAARKLKALEAILTREILSGVLPLSDVTDASDRQFNIPPGSSLAVVRHLLANRRFLVDMTQPIKPSIRLSISIP